MALKRIRVSIFMKILLISILAVSVLYVLCVWINIKGQNDVRAEIALSAQSRINFFLKSLETDFDNIISQESALINNEDIKKLTLEYSELDLYDRYNSMNRVRSKLAELKEMNGYISETMVYFPSHSIRITSSTISKVDRGEMESVKRTSVLESFPFNTDGDSISINITPELYRLSQVEAQASAFIIRVEISRAKLLTMLEQISGSDLGGALLLDAGLPGEPHRGLEVYDKKGERVLKYLSSFLEERELAKSETVMDTPDKRYIVSYGESKPLYTMLAVYIPEEQFFRSLFIYDAWFWAVSAITLMIVLLLFFWTKGTIDKPLNKLIRAFKTAEAGNFSMPAEYERNDEFGYLYSNFNDMFERLKTLMHEVYEQKLLVQNAELKQLQYQINPHFLYNSILIIHSLIRMEDYGCAMKLAQHLGNYYHYITRSGSDSVPLENEMAHAIDYIEIQNIRFSNRITADVDELPEGCAGLSVPRLIIQPIVENSYNHGLKNKLKGARLSVKVAREGQFLRFLIEDNGDEVDDGKLAQIQALLHTSGQDVEYSGLLNVHRRIRIKYGANSGVIASRGDLGGLRVEIRIELGKEHDNVPVAHRG